MRPMLSSLRLPLVAVGLCIFVGNAVAQPGPDRCPIEWPDFGPSIDVWETRLTALRKDLSALNRDVLDIEEALGTELLANEECSGTTRRAIAALRPETDTLVEETASVMDDKSMLLACTENFRRRLVVAIANAEAKNDGARASRLGRMEQKAFEIQNRVTDLAILGTHIQTKSVRLGNSVENADEMCAPIGDF